MGTMKILVACEFSGIVREAFRAIGHDAWSCDFLDAEDDSLYHIKQNVLMHLDGGSDSDAVQPKGKPLSWDMMIAFPPCTYLASSGARWFKDRQWQQEQAWRFVLKLANAPIPKIVIENPIGVLSTRWRKPDQIIQPWQFGHGETKATCLWLKNLPLLTPTNIVDGREARVHREPPSKDRWKNRSRTYQGIADAMADQWG